MLITLFVFLTTGLLGIASAGSRLWEMPIEQIRGNAMVLSKRAISVDPRPGDANVHLWPDKTITYAFADTTSKNKLKAIFFAGIEVWGELKEHGFKYNLESTRSCINDRLNCLMIYYNSMGRLSSTVAKQPKIPDEPNYEGPSMHLSDSFAVGNRDPVINTAHEIGHAWGLYHEHQNFQHWKTSPEHLGPESGWDTYTGGIFYTNRFNCKGLVDYEAKIAEVKAKIAEDTAGDQTIGNEGLEERLCTKQVVAARFKFSALEWLPTHLGGKRPDGVFDPNSLMLYPSRSGGLGGASETVDNRLPILTYADGSEIPTRRGPSPMDIAKLVNLYGTATRGVSEPYNKKGSKMENLFRKIRGESTRAGDAAGGLC